MLVKTSHKFAQGISIHVCISKLVSSFMPTRMYVHAVIKVSRFAYQFFTATSEETSRLLGVSQLAFACIFIFICIICSSKLLAQLVFKNADFSFCCVLFLLHQLVSNAQVVRLSEICLALMSLSVMRVVLRCCCCQAAF